MQYALAIHQEQRLLGHDRFHALGSTHVRVGKVEHLIHVRQGGPIHVSIHRAARRLDLPDRTSALGGVEVVAQHEQGIAHRLEIQTAQIPFIEQGVVRIDLAVGRIVRRALLIHGGIHDQPVQLLDGPALGHEPARQPVEQIRMARGVTAQSKIAWGAHDAFAEMPLPHAVHHHAGGQRIVLTGDRLREFQPAGAFVKRLAILAFDEFEKLAGHAVAQIRAFAADEDARVPRGPNILQRHGLGRRAGVSQIQTGRAVKHRHLPVTHAVAAQAVKAAWIHA